jgi:uncharacterized OsmC-like protein
MGTLNEFLAEKRVAVLERNKKAEEATGPNTLQASVSVEGRSGVRRIRIREFQVLSDSGPDFAGFNLGPSSPELQLGVLGSCLSHIFLIQAAVHNVPLDSVEVEVSAHIDGRAGKPGSEEIPVYPHDVHIASPASDEELKALHEAVERACPILNLLVNPQQINGTLVHTSTAEPVAQ